jgi:hypothetical protein
MKDAKKTAARPDSPQQDHLQAIFCDWAELCHHKGRAARHLQWAAGAVALDHCAGAASKSTPQRASAGRAVTS